MIEADLSEPISEWLQQRGFEVYTEVPFYARLVDLVGVNEERLVAVELKTSLTRAVIYQASINQLFAQESFVACFGNPRRASIERAAKYNLGVLTFNGVHVKMAKDAFPHRVFSEERGKFIRSCLSFMEPGGIAGRPCVKGVGPAQLVAKAVIEYRKEKPRATWKEIYSEVPNHYSNAKSMQGALISRGLVTKGARWHDG